MIRATTKSATRSSINACYATNMVFLIAVSRVESGDVCGASPKRISSVQGCERYCHRNVKNGLCFIYNDSKAGPNRSKVYYCASS